MPPLRVVTDSTCDLPAALIEQYNITVVPVNIHIGAQVYQEWAELTTDNYFQHLATAAPASPLHSSPPTVEAFEQVYQRIQRERSADGIVSIHLSSKLSGTYSAALAAREAHVNRPYPLAVLDSQAASMGLGLIVLQAARAAYEGASWSEVVNGVQRTVPQTHVAFFVDSVEPLLRSGRVPKLLAQAEMLRPLKPLLRLDEGQVVLFERTRTRYKALDALYTFVEDFPHIEQLVLLHATSAHETEALATRLGTTGPIPRDQITIQQYGPALALALGPGAVGVAVYEGEA